MKSAVYHKNGNPIEVIQIEEMESHELKPDEIKIEMELSSINPADIFAIMGSYPLQSPFPRIGGSEGIGKIIQIGNQVSVNFKIGARVQVPILAGIPMWSEQINVKADRVFLIPEDAKGDLKQIAMASVNPPSAYGMLTQYSKLNQGDWIIQNAANSAVGSCVIGFARQFGYKTVNVVRRDEVIESVKKIGGDIVIIDGPDLAKRLKSEYGNLNLKLGLDGVAGESTHQLAQCLSNGSTLVNYGAMSMKKCELGISQLIYKQIKLFGYWYYLWTQTAPFNDVWELNTASNKEVYNGNINVNIHKIFSLEDIHSALETAIKPKLNGKILISGPAYQI